MNHLFNPQAVVESVYIHWPFCPYKCHFCPFVALAAHDEYMEQYHKMLCKEIESFAQSHTSPLCLKTLFLGGGTPSTYPCDYLLDMFDKLNTVFTFADDKEISIEVNPGTVTEKRLKTWKQAGINRLSIGVQSLNDSVLTALNRHQKATDVVRLFEMAPVLFENISCDLILGLPGVTVEEWKENLDRLTKWPLKHISVYFLTVHENTPLYFKVATNKVTLVPDDALIELYYWTVQFLEAKGFIQYEISNFAKPGYHSRHNSAYWAYVPYKGFGLGACSFDGIARLQNEKNLMKYCKAVQDNENTTCFSEELTQQQQWLEKLMLGLRQLRGVTYSDLFNSLSDERRKLMENTLEQLYMQGLLRKTPDGIALTYKGLAVENQIVITLSSHYN